MCVYINYISCALYNLYMWHACIYHVYIICIMLYILHKYDNVFYINHITPLYMYSSHKLAGRVCSSKR